MDLQLFFDNFDVIAAAPNGVKKLRELILQLAVRGKLVPQDPADEPAGKLLERIWTEKKKLVQEKRLKKLEDIVQPNTTSLYELPENWEWVRFSDATICRDGERIPVSKDNRIHTQGQYDYYGASGVIDKVDSYLFDKPLLLIGEDGANLINRSTPIAFIASGKYWVNNHAHVIDSLSLDCLKYLEIFINAIDLKPYITGTAQPKMNQAKMNSIPVSLPPIEEQKRIVAKVDELMKLCDRLETQQQQNRSHLSQMQKSAIAQLLSAPDADAFAQHWQDIVENFELLFDDVGAIGDLRQAILQLAVQGKLVRQDSGDEPSEVVLEKIRAERQELFASGKLAKLKPTQDIEAGIDGIEAIPPSWIWTRLGELLAFGPKNGYSPKPVDYTTPVKSLTLSATTSGQFDGSCYKYIDEEIPEESHLWLQVDDILIQRGNSLEYVGISAIYTKQSERFIYPDLMMKIRLSKYTCPSYLHFVINGENSRNFFKGLASGTSGSMPKINQEVVINLPIPLPPLAEQKRIVAKVNQLMTLCDTLQAHLTQRQTSVIDLAEVAVRQVLDRK